MVPGSESEERGGGALRNDGLKYSTTRKVANMFSITDSGAYATIYLTLSYSRLGRK